MRAERSKVFEVASRAAYASALVSAVGVLFLVLLYTGLLTPAKGLLIFGPLNDACVILQYALALPAIFALHRLPARKAPGLRMLALASGLAGALGAIVFQALLLANIMPFREQIAYASGSVLLVGVWILITDLVVRRNSLGSLTVLAALYFGYPLWVYRVAKQLAIASAERVAPASRWPTQPR